MQLSAYMVEAELINYTDIPPLKDTIQTLQQCAETFYGYYDNQELSGFISYKLAEKVIDIHRLVVHPKHFRKGIAQALITFLENTIKANAVKVSTASKNIPAINLYVKHGFQLVKVDMVNDQLSLSFFYKKIAN